VPENIFTSFFRQPAQVKCQMVHTLPVPCPEQKGFADVLEFVDLA
jgi:hypothetical protein